MRVSGALKQGGQGLELDRRSEVPLPDTVRDAILVSASELTEEARAAAEAAAVAGEGFDLDLIGSLASPEGVAELLERGLVREAPSGRARSGTGSRARRCTRTCRGCAGAHCTGRSPRRPRRPARRAARSPRTGSAPATVDRARAALLRAVVESETVSRVPRRRRGRPPGARHVARGRTMRSCASTRSSATRAAPSSRASSPRRGARGASLPTSAGRRSRRRAAPARRRATSSAGNAASLRGAGMARRGARRARRPADAALELLVMANQLRISAASTATRRCSRARARGGGRTRAGWTCGCARWASRGWRREARRVRGRAGHRARRARAGAGARDDAGRGGALPAAQRGPLRRCGLPAAPRMCSRPRSASADASPDAGMESPA